MNALVGHKAKVNFCLIWLWGGDSADDGAREDGGDFTSTGAGAHLGRRGKFEVLHDGSGQ